MASFVQLTPEALRKIFPAAPQKYLDGIMAQKAALDRAGITTTRTRLKFCLANVEHECGGFTIKNLTENINYTPARAAQIWPSRFSSASQVMSMFGTAPGWQLKMFDNVYGSRMGNRPGTSDGSRFIGRGACQHTGRDGYAEMQRRTGIPCVDKPELVAEPNSQAPLIGAFWSWKNMNPTADAGDFRAVRRKWNGGYIGIADVETKLRGNDPVIAALAFAESVTPILNDLPGGPVPNKPPQDAIDNATKKERATRNAGGATAAAGGAGEATSAGTKQPDKPAVLSPMLTYSVIAIGVVAFVVGVILIANKIKRVKENWV
jgi:predicted chitinase